MQSKLAMLSVVVFTIILAACNRKTVSLDYTNANSEVPQLGNLVFRFSKPLVKDSLLNQWDSTEYVSFEPKIPGRFRWEHPDELVFSPERPLQPATTYKVKINNDVLQYTPFNKVEKAKDLTFHTPDLKLDNINATWVLQSESSQSAVPQIDLYFNYPVDPVALKDKLSIEVDGKSANYIMQTVSTDNKITLRLLNIRTEDKDYTIKISLNKGLLPKDGSNPLKEDASSKSSIPSPYTLIINDVQTEHDGNVGKIFVRTSQQVVPASLSTFIKLDPAVKFNAEVTDDGFMISSEQFSAEKSYDLILAKGLRGTIGGQLREEYKNTVAFGKLEPSLSFTNSKAVYLSAQGAKNIEVKIINVPKIKVIVSKIYESNLLAAQRYGYYPKESSANSGGSEEYYEGGSGDATLGDVIYEKEIDTKTLPQSGSGRLFNFNLEDRVPDFKGIYHIKIRSMDDYWVSDSRFISLSDIGLVAKEGKEKIFVFANSIKTAQSLKDVNVIAYGANNQVLGIGNTNGDGVAEIAFTRKDLAGFKPAMIIAKTASDFNYLPFNNTAVNTSRFSVGGKRSNSTGFDAFVYAERDIYRPGEKVNFSVILRDAQWKSPGELPIKLKFLLPNGKELKSFRKNLNAQGGLDGSVDISTAAITGSYTLEVYTSNDVLIGSKNFMIEEFVPDRIKVTTKLDKQFLQPGESTILNINAVNFFGPPAANRNYESEIQVKQKAFNSKKYNRYDFSLANQNSFFDKQVKEGSTDGNGNASIDYAVPDMYRNIGILQTSFYTTVFDETGRPVSRNSSIDIYTQNTFFGIGDDGYGYFPLNQAIKFPIIALDKTEKLANATAKIDVIKHEYRTVLEKSGDYFRYNSQKEDKVVATGNITVSGENTGYSFVPRSPGDYEIRVSIPGASSYVSKSFYSYGYWGGDNNSFEVNTEGQIDIETDKEAYKTGENVKVLFKTPFSGRMLVTMEKDKVLSYQYVNVEKRSASLDLKLTAEHLPNVYITATLIKPHEVSDIPLTVAHGFKNVKVEEESRQIKVQVIASQSVRSHTHQKVKVKAEPGSMITLAAVDNGVLQVTDFKTPDPYNYFYGQRALEVNAYDLYPLLFPEIKARLSSTGGDGNLRMDQRVNPMPNKRVKIVSYWSGITTANGSGEAEFEFDIPQFSGELRLMAVAYKNENFGSSESVMKVADPIVLSTAMPRFLSPKDTISVPVTISNTTNNNTSASATISVQGPLQIVSSNRESVSVAANSEARVEFKVVAAPTVAAGKVKIEVQGMGEKFIDETDITVRPASTLQKMTGSGVIAANSSKQVAIPSSDFMPGSVNYKLVVSKSPALELASQLSYLVQYPYGCTEQTVSSAFPQLYFADLSELLQADKASKASANSNVMEAIRKIKMRQLYSGAITMWDNDTENWWATVYAAHFLWEAKKAGYDVDAGLLETTLTYINNKLRNKETINYYYNRDQQKKIAPKEVAYSLYVLAIAGRPNVSVMNYYKANPALLSLDSKYLLAAAYAIAGDKAKFKEMLPTSFSGETSVAQTGGSFYSDIRDEAIALNSLVEVEPSNSQVPVMAKHVVDKLKGRSWYTTQESSFGFLAIGKLAAAANKSSVTAQIKANGKVVGNVSNAPVKLSAKELGSTNVEIDTKGNGQVYYWWQSEGISISGSYKEEDSYIKVRKRFFDRNGRAITSNTFKQNDLVIVQLTLEKSYSGSVENIVITDLLPAGFEIENPRTKEIPGMDWIKDDATPTALDVRDDRINLFVDADNNKKTYYYAVRVVSPGVYHMGPVSADAMYNGEYHSYNGAGTIVITQR